MTVQAWAPKLLDEASKYISSKLAELDEASEGYEFERSELENHLTTTFPKAPHGAVVGALNRFLKSQYGVERPKRGWYIAYVSTQKLLIGDGILNDSIAYLQDQIVGVTTIKTGLTETDIEMITGINLAIKELKKALATIEELD